jgi:hypothetical protein
MRQATRHLLLVSLATFALAAATASTASAAPAHATNLCSSGKTVLRSLAAPPTSSSLSASQAQAALKTNIGKIVGSKSHLVSAAPKSLKKAVGNVVAFYAILQNYLGRAGWSYAALATQPGKLQKLETAAAKASASFVQINRYVLKNCHV